MLKTRYGNLFLGLLAMAMALAPQWTLANQDKPAEQDEQPSPAKLAAEADRSLQKGDFAKAAELLQKIVDQDDENDRAWHLLGFALHSQNKLDEAIKAHEKAAESEYFGAISLYNLGCAYSLKKEPDKAFDYLKQAAKAGYLDTDQFKKDKDLDSLREDPRFEQLMEFVKSGGREKFDPAKIVGDWKYAAGTKAGEKLEADRLAGDVVITKETFTIPGGPTEKFVMSYKIDASHDPARIDLKIDSGPVPDGKALGIIKMDGEQLVLCYDSTGEKRPEKFQSTEENGFFMFTLKRHEKEQEKEQEQEK
jgi:uncharacterized protein (TIGR03067 family)